MHVMSSSHLNSNFFLTSTKKEQCHSMGAGLELAAFFPNLKKYWKDEDEHNFGWFTKSCYDVKKTSCTAS